MTRRRALLDTSVLVAMRNPDEAAPDLTRFDELFVSSLSYAEMRMGLATVDGADRARRQDRLDAVTNLFGAGLVFDDSAALEFGRIARATIEVGRSPRNHVIDRMIAAVAAAHGLVLVTRNPADVSGLETLVDITTL
ncbi:PIN domain-containing protein [uncultured Williamsia sp.]|uniref:PIN domain-containing protein n=1 Tax=uncultured Williamsia sp. TaxID=259311 RepID=UPI00260518DB|nr:PIN domain-containing protein [uncultured Williamsia sp.]